MLLFPPGEDVLLRDRFQRRLAKPFCEKDNSQRCAANRDGNSPVPQAPLSQITDASLNLARPSKPRLSSSRHPHPPWDLPSSPARASGDGDLDPTTRGRADSRTSGRRIVLLRTIDQRKREAKTTVYLRRRGGMSSG